MKVYILKTYLDGEDPFGVECVFNTLQVGFPTADIYTTENIHKIDHHIWIEQTVKFAAEREPDEPIVFCDTDMIFYNNIEVHLADIPQLLAGRLCPAFWNEVANANECQRFHTSLLFIKSPRELMEKINAIYGKLNSAYKPFTYNAFAPVRYTISGNQYVHDTCGNLFHCLNPIDKYEFPSQMLDLYTHLVSGSMVNFVASRQENKIGLKSIHAHAKADPMSVFGIWREQLRYYHKYAPRFK